MFALRLKELREKNNLSQKAFALKMGISQSTVGMWESGKREPNFNMIEQVANYFNVSVDYLLGRTEEKNTDEKDDITFDAFTFAMYDEAQHLTEEDKQALLQMARLLKSKTEKKE